MLRLCVTVLMAAIGLVGCATGSNTSSAGDGDSASARDQEVGPESPAMLLRLAEAELADPVMPREVDVPPMIPPRLLRASDAPKASLSRDEVLKRAMDRTPTPAPKPRETVEDERRDEALGHYIRGREASIRQQHLAAVVELRKALELDPNEPEIMRQLARSYHNNGNLAQATQMYEAILDVEPRDPEAVLFAALSRANARDFEETIDLLARVTADGGRFTFDPAAPTLADFTLAVAFRELGYDRALIETAQRAADFPARLDSPTRFVQHLNSVARQQGELWRDIGDAHVRLGEYDDAMDAYSRAVQHPNLDAASVHPRMIYALLTSGRTYAAQQYFLEVVVDGEAALDDETIRLGAYLKAECPDVDLLARAVADRYRDDPENIVLLRTTAAMVSDEQAEALLRDAVLARPRNLRIVADVLGRIVEADPDAAVDLALELSAQHPDRIFAYAERLARQSPDPYALLVRLEQRRDAGEVEAMFRASAAVHAEAIGRAWRICDAALERHPDSRLLPVMRIHLAAALEDPALIEQAIDAAPDPQTSLDYRARSAGYRVAERLDRALSAAERAVELDDDDYLSKVALARVHAERVLDAADDESRDRAVGDLESAVKACLDLQPESTEAFDVMLEVFGPGAERYDRSTFNEIVRRLEQTHGDSALYERLVARDELLRGRFEPALQRALRLAERDPFDDAALALAVSAWAQLEQYEEARQWLEQRLARRPGDPALFEQWTRLMVEMGRIDDVERRLNGLLEQYPDHPVALRLLEHAYRAADRIDDAVRIGRRRQAMLPPSINRDLRLAAFDARVGESRSARQRLRSILDRHDEATSRQLITAIELATQFGNGGGGDLAGEFASVYLNAGHTPYFIVYAVKLRSLAQGRRTGEPFDAVLDEAVQRAVQQDGQSAAFVTDWTGLAQSLFDEGHKAEAARVLRRRLLDGDELYDQGLGYLLSAYLLAAASCHPDAGEAIETLEAVVDERGGRPRMSGSQYPLEPAAVFFEAAILFDTVGHSDGAAELYAEVLERDDQHVMAMNNLGYMRLTNGRDGGRTSTLIEDAHAQESEDPNITDSLGWLRYKQGRFQADDEDEPGAVELLERAAELSERGASAEVYDHLGDALWRVGRAEDAVDAWRQAMDVLDDVSHRRDYVENIGFAQRRVWGLVVIDAETIYDQRYGALRDRIARKLERVRVGEAPPVAETFAEQRRAATVGAAAEGR